MMVFIGESSPFMAELFRSVKYSNSPRKISIVYGLYNNGSTMVNNGMIVGEKPSGKPIKSLNIGHL